ncbi:LysM peptidoglycan-binding domain-containing protein [Micromonospora gifhornensis]|uniref:LysM peptidoglycan-binding domain-containing protein n=1 Tax=Micromonospora gifhornensis TaxID=84594 RepID=UPI00366991D3
MLLITALPFLLLWAAGNPLPDLASWAAQAWNDPGASLSDLWRNITSRDDGSLFIQALTLLGWVALAVAGWGWISFLVAVVVEIPTQLRSRRTGGIPHQPRRIPGLRLQQRAAAVLVAAAIGIIAAPSLSSAAISTAPGPTPAAVTAEHVVTEASARTTDQVQTNPGDGYLEHRVSRGEGLLDIAERYHVPWQRIADATYGLEQPDGRQLQPGSTRVYPGWTVRIPASAGQSPALVPAAHNLLATATTEAPTTNPVYTVVRGDRLWDIAERFLGDPRRYPDIAKLNPAAKKADARFPDHIVATQQLRLPTDAHDRGVREHARGTVSDDAPAQHKKPLAPRQERDPQQPSQTAPSQPSPTPSQSTPPAPAPVQPTQAAQAQPSPTTTAGTTTPADDAGDEAAADQDDNATIITISALTSASLVAALVLTTVRRLRRRQRQHRRPGRRLPHPRNGATEKALLVAEQPADVDRLDAALRSLATALAGREHAELPDIAAAWIIDRTVDLVLTRPCPSPPAPWTADGTHWTLPPDAELATAEGQLAPLPTLVAVGSQPGRHLMLDLERLGSLTIGGDDERSLALLRYVASELACNSWSDEVEVVLAGFPLDQTERLIALNPDRVRAVASVTEAAARLRRRAATIAAALQHTGVGDTLYGRITDVGEAWAPQVFIVANPDEEGTAALGELAADLDRAGRCSVAIVTASPRGQTFGRNSVTIDNDATLNLDLPFLQATATAAGLPAAELEPLAEIMQQARAVADEQVPPAAEPETWATDTDAAGSLLPPPPDEVPAPDDGWGEPDLAPNPAVGQEPILDIPQQLTAIPATATTTAAPNRVVAAAVRQRRKQVDPHLDADLDAWRQQDPTRPRIGILGPATVDAPGAMPDQRRRFHAELIVYLAQRGARGATREQLTEAMWPDQHVKDTSRRVAITRARRWLGDTPDGNPWLPEMGPDRVYRLEEGYLLDWHLFRRLRSRGEAHGPAGIRDLRAALELIRGVPLDGADRAYAAGARNPYTWLAESDIYPGHITSAIVDTAHLLATMYLDTSDTTNARWAVQQAWAADPHRGDDGPWHDLMRAAYIEGHSAELRNLLGELMNSRDAEVPEDLAPTTYAWLLHLLPDVLGASAPVG